MFSCIQLVICPEIENVYVSTRRIGYFAAETVSASMIAKRHVAVGATFTHI